MPANSFNDQLCTEDLLSSQKFLSGNYNNAVHESANSELRRDLTDIQRQEQEAANKIFQVMNQRGWYQVAPADPQMLNKARTQAQQAVGPSGATQGLGQSSSGMGSAMGSPAGMGPTMGGTGGGMGSAAGGSSSMGPTRQGAGGMSGMSRGATSGPGPTFQSGSGGSSGMSFQNRGGKQTNNEKRNF